MDQTDPLTAAHAEIALLVEEVASWRQLYETYCKPEDVRAMEEQRDVANKRADYHAEQNRHLTEEFNRLREMLKERNDWAQRVWLAWTSARDRARRVATELADAREDQEWLGFLNEAGIDNSPAYDYACQLRREARRAAAVPSGAEEVSGGE